MFAAGVSHDLQARHYLRGDFGEESEVHSHPYRVEAVFRTSQLDANGFSTDIAFIDEALKSELAKINEVLLNDLDFFKDQQPSLENLCRYLWQRLELDIREEDLSLPDSLEIRIWEAENAWASYVSEVDGGE